MTHTAAEIVATVRQTSLSPERRGSSPIALYLARLNSDNSRRTMLTALRKVARIISGDDAADPVAFPWHRLRYEQVEAVRAVLMADKAPATVNQALYAIRGVLKACWRLQLISGEDLHRAIDVQAVNGSRLPAGREVRKAEIARMVEACDLDTLSGARNAALLAVLAGCGLRRAEAAGLRLEDFDAETGALRVLRGKGAKQRTAYATNGTLDALRGWLRLRGDAPGALLCRVGKGGRIHTNDRGEAAHVSPQAVRDAVERMRKAAGIGELAPHDLRRTYAGEMLDAGADLATVQGLMGHASPTTTSRYDRRGERAKAKAAALHHFPYPPPNAAAGAEAAPMMATGRR